MEASVLAGAGTGRDKWRLQFLLGLGRDKWRLQFLLGPARVLTSRGFSSCRGRDRTGQVEASVLAGAGTVVPLLGTSGGFSCCWDRAASSGGFSSCWGRDGTSGDFSSCWGRDRTSGDFISCWGRDGKGQVEASVLAGAGIGMGQGGGFSSCRGRDGTSGGFSSCWGRDGTGGDYTFPAWARDGTSRGFISCCWDGKGQGTAGSQDRASFPAGDGKGQVEASFPAGGRTGQVEASFPARGGTGQVEASVVAGAGTGQDGSSSSRYQTVMVVVVSQDPHGQVILPNGLNIFDLIHPDLVRDGSYLINPSERIVRAI